jgi:predicted PolB exonuclease-like 3'-5' exonuclease
MGSMSLGDCFGPQMDGRGMRPKLVFDIETVKDPAVPYEGTEFAPPACWTVVTIGCMEIEGGEHFGCVQGASEAGRIAKFFAYIDRTKPQLVSWNGRGFDVPVLTMRALKHGITLPTGWFGPARARYRDDVHWDLMDFLADHGAGRPTKLDHAARLVGMPGKLGVSGSDVAGLSQAETDAYCMTDVAQTAALALRCMLLRGTLTREQYRDAAGRLVARIEANPATKVVAEHMDRNVFLLKGGT